MILTFIIILILLLLTAWIITDILRNRKIPRINARPEENLNTKESDVLLALEKGQLVNWNDLEDTYTFVNSRYDCSDFRLQSLIRILYEHTGKIDQEAFQKIKSTFLNFRYWMDQPGADGMCFWSENHQLLFATSEFLAGQFWPEETFTNDGKTGAEHKAMGRKRILTWLEQRWRYGFTEWYSNTYYVEDIAPLSNLIDFADDEEIVRKATIILDLLLHDLATQSYKGIFISTSGRMYEEGKKHGKDNAMRKVTKHIWDDKQGDTAMFPKTGITEEDTTVNHAGMDLNFLLLKNYKVPDVIKSIGEDTSTVIIKASNGLNLDQLKDEGLLGQDDPQIMMQLAMEAFTNPEVISNTIKYVERNDLFTNEFLHDLKLVNIGFLKTFNLLPAVSRLLKPVSDCAAIQRANSYTYKTSDYMLATAQAYHPGTLGDQHHIWNATISPALSIFTTHPAKPLSGEGALSNSPGYWVGNGRQPHAVQHRNIVLCLYRIPEKPTFMEPNIEHYTHAHFPSEVMDTVVLDGRFAFGKYRNVFVAFIGKIDLYYRDNTDDDLLQDGRDAFWIFEISTEAQEGTFERFMDRIRSNAVHYAGKALSYTSDGHTLEVTFGQDFKVDGQVIDTEYPRFDSPYSQTPRKPDTITLEHQGKKLFLDFYKGVREEG